MISIIIPVYKTEPYLRRCVDSVLNQTYTDLEIILVDDGSPDGCGAICDEYAERDSRVKVIHKKNGGLSSALNAGLDVVTGEYISFLDSDDYNDLDMYQRMLELAQQRGADIVECDARWVRPDRVISCEDTDEVREFTNLEALETLYFGDQMFHGISISKCTKLYRSELLRNQRFLEGCNFEDVLYTPKILYRAKKVVRINHTFCNFYMTPQSITRGGWSLKHLDAIKTRKAIMEFFRDEKQQKLYEYTASLYYDTLYGSYYETRIRKGDQFKSAAKELHQTIGEVYQDVLSNPYSLPKWKYRLFAFSPAVWCVAVKGIRLIRYWNWRYRRFKRLRNEKRQAKANKQ